MVGVTTEEEEEDKVRTGAELFGVCGLIKVCWGEKFGVVCTLSLPGMGL